MAIQVSGTTVIDGSRVLSNVTGLKTVGGTAILGSGDIAVGGSTTLNDIGTYAICGNSNVAILPGGTVAGSYLTHTSCAGFPSGGTLSGTFKAMGYGRGGGDGTTYLRIS
jgi:hypothetical protein